MTVFRWIIAVLAGLLAIGALLSFAVFMVQGRNEWILLARRFRRWTWAACLFWFNVEIWGRVVWTIVHWNG